MRNDFKSKVLLKHDTTSLAVYSMTERDAVP